MATILKALDGEPSALKGRQQASAVLHMLGLDAVVQATFSREGTVLHLDCRTLSDAETVCASGRLTNGRATDLGDALVQRLAVLFSGNQLQARGYDSEDSYAKETFARAMVFLAERQWIPAAALLELLLQLEPESVTVRLWLVVRTLMFIESGGGTVRGRQLLTKAAVVGDERLQARFT